MMEMSAVEQGSYVAFVSTTSLQLSGSDCFNHVITLFAIAAYVIGGGPDMRRGGRGKVVQFVAKYHFMWYQVIVG